MSHNMIPENVGQSEEHFVPSSYEQLVQSQIHKSSLYYTDSDGELCVMQGFQRHYSELQEEFGEPPIWVVPFNARSRDELPEQEKMRTESLSWKQRLRIGKKFVLGEIEFERERIDLEGGFLQGAPRSEINTLYVERGYFSNGSASEWDLMYVATTRPLSSLAKSEDGKVLYNFMVETTDVMRGHRINRVTKFMDYRDGRNSELFLNGFFNW